MSLALLAVQPLEVVDALLRNFRYNYWVYGLGFSSLGVLLWNAAFSVTIALHMLLPFVSPR